MTRPTGWTAIIPFKPPGTRKTRLATHLSAPERDDLSETLFRHVAQTLKATPAIARIALLSQTRPPVWSGLWLADQGRGLNTELHHAQQILGPDKLLVIHADLPFVSPGDIACLITEAETGCAIAPDRHGTGTNALALRDAANFPFSFGANSFQRHVHAAKAPARIVERPGFSLDIDAQADLDLAISQGLAPFHKSRVRPTQ
jgi:2-phospho-L-lactate guanylyltransferase